MQLETINEATIISLLPLVADQGWVVRNKGGATEGWISTGEYSGKCPICALVWELSGGAIDHDLLGVDAMRKLSPGLTQDEKLAVVNVMNAVDKVRGHCPALRASILRHLGITEH